MDQNISENQLIITEEMLSHLTSTRKWTLFLSIIGFIGSTFLVIIGLFAGVFIKAITHSTTRSTPSFLAILIYVTIGVLHFISSLYLFRFSAKMKVAIASKSNEEMTNSFEHLLSYFVYAGIITIVSLVVVVLIIIIVIVFGILSPNGSYPRIH